MKTERDEPREIINNFPAGVFDAQIACATSVSPCNTGKARLAARKIMQNDTSRHCSARYKLLLSLCNCSYPSPSTPSNVGTLLCACMCVCVCAERNSAGRNANALECQRLTPRDGCTAFDVIMVLLYSSIRLQKVPGGQWCTQLSPRRGERCLFDHGQASNREATHRKK